MKHTKTPWHVNAITAGRIVGNAAVKAEKYQINSANNTADAGALLTDALDRAERHAPNPGFCYTPERCAGKTCCPHNPSCTE